jgi:hypothetical protein
VVGEYAVFHHSGKRHRRRASYTTREAKEIAKLLAMVP